MEEFEQYLRNEESDIVMIGFCRGVFTVREVVICEGEIDTVIVSEGKNLMEAIRNFTAEARKIVALHHG